jgi:hypothetical protein
MKGLIVSFIMIFYILQPFTAIGNVKGDFVKK